MTQLTTKDLNIVNVLRHRYEDERHILSMALEVGDPIFIEEQKVKLTEAYQLLVQMEKMLNAA